jgi:hypothetical protein
MFFRSTSKYREHIVLKQRLFCCLTATTFNWNGDLFDKFTHNYLVPQSGVGNKLSLPHTGLISATEASFDLQIDLLLLRDL